MDKHQRSDIADDLAHYSELLVKEVEADPGFVLLGSQKLRASAELGCLHDRMDAVRALRLPANRLNDVFLRLRDCEAKLKAIAEQQLTAA